MGSFDLEAGWEDDSFARLRRLVRICDRFEASLRSGSCPVIADLLLEVPEAERPELARRLVSLLDDSQKAQSSTDIELGSMEAVSSDTSPSGTALTDPIDPAGQEGSPDLDQTLSLESPELVRSFQSTSDHREIADQPGWRDHLGPGSTFGDYEVIGLVGRGGMGVVYRARQRKMKLDRIVALKLIRADRLGDPSTGSNREIIGRFQIETQAAASLEHDHVVAIFDAGERGGRLYYSMQFVEGESLDKLLQAGPVSGRRAAAILEPIARAVQAAHDRRIIHRDVKPSNILIDLSGKPYLSDFGLAKFLGDAEGLTISRAQLGSPPYMSPEQVRDSCRVGPATDIYSLGATLYGLLTGRPPFQAAEPLETMRQVVDELPVAPRRLNPSIPRDLETLCLKCLEKEPDRRFESAGKLADELRRYLREEPILTRPIPLWDRAFRWFRRRPAIAGMLAAILLVAMLGLGLVLNETRKTNEARLALESTNRLLSESNRSLKVRSYRDQIVLAYELIVANRLTQAEETLDQCSGPLRGWEWRHLQRRCHEKPASWRGHPGTVYGLAFRPDGAEIACAGRGESISLWDARTNRSTGSLGGIPAGVKVLRVAWGRAAVKGDRIVAACSDGSIRIWDRTGPAWDSPRAIQAHSGSVNDVAIEPGGFRIASSGTDGRIVIWDGVTGERVRTLQESGDSVQAIAFGPGGQALVSAGDDRKVRLWDMSIPGSSRVLGELNDQGQAVAFSPDGRRVAAADGDGTLCIWDLGVGLTRSKSDFKALTDGINALAFNPDGRRLASAGADGLVRLWDPVEGVEVLTLRDQPGENDGAVEVEGLAFSPDGERLASAGADGMVDLWNATPWDRVRPARPIELLGHEKPIAALTVRPDGGQIASGSADGEIRLWDPTGSLRCRSLLGHRDRVNALAYSPDGKKLASAGRGREVRVWFLDGSRESQVVGISPGKVVALAFLPDGRHIVTGGDEQAIRIWDADQIEPPLVLCPTKDEVFALAVSPNGRLLASAGAGTSITLWDLTGKGAPPIRLVGHARQVNALAFSPSSRTLFSVSHDWTGRVWNLDQKGDLTSLTLRGHVSRVWGVAASPDGCHVATAGSDGLVRVWNVSQGREIARLAGHDGRVYIVAFDPKGRFLASAGRDAIIRLWDHARWPDPSSSNPAETCRTIEGN